MTKYTRSSRPTRGYSSSGVFSQASYLEMEAEQHRMKLRQMEGEVLQLNAKCCYVRFHIGDFRLSYVYNINKSNRYFLERLKPYPLPLKEYENAFAVLFNSWLILMNELIFLLRAAFLKCSKSRRIVSITSSSFSYSFKGNG